MKTKDLPVIFIFDLDNTLIGDSANLYTGYKTLLDFIADKCKHKKLKGPICNINKEDWKEIISDNLFRPHLKQSFIDIKSIYPSAEFFIFSKGTKPYVSSMVEIIEERFAIKFNRPLLAREDASLSGIYTYQKDIEGYQDTICKSLSKKYPKLRQEKYKTIVFTERTIIIDDDTTVWQNDPRQIVCKEYNYMPTYEVSATIIEIIRQNPIVQQFIKENSDIKLPIPFVSSDKSYEECRMDYHIYLANAYRKNLAYNLEQIKDDFFLKFLKAISKRKHLSKPFTADYIKRIKSKII
jgi:hypothetical protein